MMRKNKEKGCPRRKGAKIYPPKNSSQLGGGLYIKLNDPERKKRK
jgi:hypothetical protein